jgi:hypothetical protein
MQASCRQNQHLCMSTEPMRLHQTNSISAERWPAQPMGCLHVMLHPQYMSCSTHHPCTTTPPCCWTCRGLCHSRQAPSDHVWLRLWHWRRPPTLQHSRGQWLSTPRMEHTWVGFQKWSLFTSWTLHSPAMVATRSRMCEAACNCWRVAAACALCDEHMPCVLMVAGCYDVRNLVGVSWTTQKEVKPITGCKAYCDAM